MEKIKDISSYLRSQSGRNYLLFMFGVYTGLRILDILQFRVRDVAGRDYIMLREKRQARTKESKSMRI